MVSLKWPNKLVPLKGVVYFVVILLSSHFFWKYTMIGDESDDVVTFFGIDLTNEFELKSKHVAHVTSYMLDVLGYDVTLEGGKTIRHDNQQTIRIVWACSGLKQAYIFFVIIFFYAGPWKHKLWYIPSGLLIVYLFNLFRIIYIVAQYKHHPESFYFLHEHLFKYLFYGVIFLMWVLWEEKVRWIGNTTQTQKPTLQK